MAQRRRYSAADVREILLDSEEASESEYSLSSDDNEPEQIARDDQHENAMDQDTEFRQVRRSSRIQSQQRGVIPITSDSEGEKEDEELNDVPEDSAEESTEDSGPFKWQWYDDDYQPDWLPLYNRRTGLLVDTSAYNPAKFFQLFFPDELFQLMVDETNQYALQFFDQPAPLPANSRFLRWKDTNISEMKAYISLKIAMGLCCKPQIEDYWSKYWLTSLKFSSVMSRDRFELISSFLHFNNNSDQEEYGQPGYDPLFKIRTVLNIVDPLYESVYCPRRELSIDESMIKFKGRLFFRQFLPLKPTRFGIKQFALCESKSGYALRFITYTGKAIFAPLEGWSMSESVVLKLLEGYENKGHTVFMYSFYSSPQLYSKMEQLGLGACGTVNPARKYMPKSLQKDQLQLKKGDDPKFMRSDSTVACVWQDTKRVSFISNFHCNNTINKRVRARGYPGGRRSVLKPYVAHDYNQHMGGVDLMDQKLGSYSYPQKSQKWYFTVFHRVMEVALVNGYIIYCKSQPDNTSVLSPRHFRQHVIDGLLDQYQPPQTKVGRPAKCALPIRLTERHFLGQNTSSKPDCVVCSRRERGGKRKQTTYFCKQCQVHMCAIPCFEAYHTKKDFKQIPHHHASEA